MLYLLWFTSNGNALETLDDAQAVQASWRKRPYGKSARNRV